MKNLTLITVLALAVLGFGLSACETVEGAGQDIQNAGQSIEDAAE